MRGCVLCPCCCLQLLKRAEADPCQHTKPGSKLWSVAGLVVLRLGCCCCWRMRLAYRPHQSTVPPASASIFMNSWATCWGLRFTPRWGPSLAQNSSMSSSPDPSSSAACGEERYGQVGVSLGCACSPYSRAGSRASKICLSVLSCSRLISLSTPLSACSPLPAAPSAMVLCGAGCSSSGS